MIFPPVKVSNLRGGGLGSVAGGRILTGSYTIPGRSRLAVGVSSLENVNADSVSDFLSQASLKNGVYEAAVKQSNQK